MTRALVPSAVAATSSAEKSEPLPEKVPTSLVVFHPGPVTSPVETTGATPEPESGTDTDDPGDGTPTVAKKRKKKKGKGAQAETERRRDFARVDRDKDRPALAGSWGYGPGDERVEAALGTQQSFNFLWSLSLDQRKLVTADDVRAGGPLTDKDWTARRRSTWRTLTSLDKDDLKRDWGLSELVFATAMANDKNYQYVRALAPENRRSATVPDINKTVQLSAEDWTIRRRSRFDTLSAEDRAALAVDWGIPVDDPRFAAAIQSQACYQFVRDLPPHNRRAADVTVITKAKALKPGQWAALRRERLATLTDEDTTTVVATWNLPPDDKKVIGALAAEDAYQYFRALTDDQRRYVSMGAFRKRKMPSVAEIDLAKKEVAKKEKEEAARLRREAGVLQWSEFQRTLRLRVRIRVEAELPEFAWQPLVDSVLAAIDKKIVTSPDINIPGQIKAADKDVDAGLDREAKRRAVEEAAKAAPPKLRTTLLIKKEVLADDNLTLGDFTDRIAKAWHDQRNPSAVEKWATWLGLTMYRAGAAKPFDRLADHGEPKLGAHFSLDERSLSLPLVDDTTTPDALLDQLFDATKRAKRDCIHVSLETGVEAAPDKLKLPHRYWSKIGTAGTYELRFGSPSKVRWKPTHTEATIKTALDDAYTEMLTVLRAKARRVLDNGGGY